MESKEDDSKAYEDVKEDLNDVTALLQLDEQLSQNVSLNTPCEFIPFHFKSTSRSSIQKNNTLAFCTIFTVYTVYTRQWAYVPFTYYLFIHQNSNENRICSIESIYRRNHHPCEIFHYKAVAPSPNSRWNK